MAVAVAADVEDASEFIRRSEFRELASDVRDIDREVAAMKTDISITKSDMQELKQGQRDLLTEFRKSQSVRGIINGSWAALGAGFALGLAKLMGVVP